jgi:hypothetical protein
VAPVAAACGACTLLAPSDATYTSEFDAGDATTGDESHGDAGSSAEAGCPSWCDPLPDASVGSWAFPPGSSFDAGSVIDAGHCHGALLLDGVTPLTLTSSEIKNELWVAFWLEKLPSPVDSIRFVKMDVDTQSNPGIEVKLPDAGAKLVPHPSGAARDPSFPL